ncbi:MAG TPA: ABC transporter permease [Vicinamibacterales bacterium]|nr:ABC transporter permease [Vicinamibacterales bacterium]
MQDLRHGLRALAGHPGYLASALLTLALGIGFNTATFSVIDAVLLRPLPYAAPSQLVMLRERKLPQFPEFSVAPGNFLTWRAQTTADFAGMAPFEFNSRGVAIGRGDPERIEVDAVGANLFHLLGAAPVLGRAFTGAEEQEGAAPVVILSHGTWQRRFGSAADVVGRVIRIDTVPTTIVGVMPDGLAFPGPHVEMWVPLVFTAEARQRFGSHYISAIARLRPGVPLDRARADLGVVARRLAAAHPGDDRGWEVLAIPLQTYEIRDVRTSLLVLLGAVAFVLLIACVNVASLLLARGAGRRRELAVRSALGATRPRLIRQLLVENFALSFLGAALGLLTAAWLLRLLLLVVPGALPRQADIGLDRDVLLFTLGLACVTPLLFGLLPALQASRLDLRDLLAMGGRQGSAAPARRMRFLLVAAEVALAMMLLVGAGLLIRSFAALEEESPGFAADHAVEVRVNLPERKYHEPAAMQQFFRTLVDRVSVLPTVTAAGLTQSMPLVSDMVDSFEIEGAPPLSPTDRPTANFYAVSSGYFSAMGIPLIRGRAIAPTDRLDAPRVTVINQTLANRYFSGRNPIGQRIRVSQGADAWRQIVGVVGDVKQYGLDARSSAQIYESYQQHPYFSGFALVVRTTAPDPGAIVPRLRSTVHDLDRDVPLSGVRTLDDVVAAAIRPQRFSAILIGLFAVSALLLAAVGLYGVMAYTVGQRAQEFAIRIAHGATRRDILRLVLSSAAWVSLTGVAAGLAGALLLRHVLAGLLFGVGAADPLTYAGVGVLLTAVAAVASAVPAIRATRVDPIVALRGD